MTQAEKIMVVVHPGSACGSADMNIGEGAGWLREALARDIMSWPHDMMIVDGELSDEIPHYAVLALAFENAADNRNRRMLRHRACDADGAGWTDSVRDAFASQWPGGPHRILVTGAWLHPDGGGCVGAVVDKLHEHEHKVEIAASTLRLEA